MLHDAIALRQLHWLPVRERILFRLALPVHEQVSTLYTVSLRHLSVSDDCKFVTEVGWDVGGPLRSADV